MTDRIKSEINNFIGNMGNNSANRIPVVYMEDTVDLAIENNGKITNKKQRYSDGTNIVFKCSGCKDLIGCGKKTKEPEDKVKIYCYKCKNYHEFGGAIIWNKNPLWYKPESEENRKQYEILINEFVNKNNPEIQEI